jgi:tRNA threonylcarbamoyladenosine biosynthesis protein TsaE
MPVWDEHHLEFFSLSPPQTQRLGIRLGRNLQTGDLICLQGEIGSGKTTFVRGVASGWGSPDPVSSPTFVLVNEYRRPDGLRLYHLDAYRLAHLQEALELDLEAMLTTGALIVEWAERLTPLFPTERLWIVIEYVDEEVRRFWFEAQGKRYDLLLQQLRTSIYGA